MTDNGILVMLYLYHVDGLPCHKIAELLEESENHRYADGTIRNYARYTYANRINEAKSLFADNPPLRRMTTILSENRMVWGSTIIEFIKTTEESALDERKAQRCYLFKFYDEKNRPIFTKIGTTTVSALKRLKQEITYYTKHDIEIAKVTICGIVDCGDLPAEGLESYLRACFIRDFPEGFHKNDRFFDMDIPTEYFFTCAEYYFNTPTPYEKVIL